MTFAEVLPALSSGRVCKRTGGWEQFEYRLDDKPLLYRKLGDVQWEGSIAELGSLLASDWEVVEEPAKPDLSAVAMGLDAPTLRRERDESRAEVKYLEGQVESHGAAIARLERELAEARSPCMCVSSSVHARCAMPGGHPGKIHTDGSYVWLV